MMHTTAFVTSIFWLLSRVASAAPLSASVCSNVGVDIDDGTYIVEGEKQGVFSFASKFTGTCNEQVIAPVLRDEANREYACSLLDSSNTDVQVSTCDVEYAQMNAGIWTILMQNTESRLDFTRNFEIHARRSEVIVNIISTLVASTAAAEVPVTAPGWSVDTAADNINARSVTVRPPGSQPTPPNLPNMPTTGTTSTLFITIYGGPDGSVMTLS